MKLKITIEDKVYEVEVEATEPEQPHPGYVPAFGQAHVPAAPPGAAPPLTPTPLPSGERGRGEGPSADETKMCRSPISGVVVRVPVQVGQAIQVNDVLLVLEAMKMETVITSSVAGRITKVHASVGDAVQGGQVLVEFS